MKYLKLFESFDDEGYEMIPQTSDPNNNPEGDRMWMEHKVIQLTDYTFNYIKKLLIKNCECEIVRIPQDDWSFVGINGDGHEWVSKTMSEEHDYVYMGISLGNELTPFEVNVRVDECKDDWFRISWSQRTKEKNNIWEIESYICDQLDAVENVLRKHNLVR